MTAWLDRVTGRITMYRLIVLSLLAVAAVALVLALTGQLFYTPVEILATGAVAVAVTWASGRVFAAVFRTRAHPESSIITGLLLLFLFRPTIDPVELATIALAALLATASKYVLAVRGRHLLNPAAAGALIVSLLQLNFSAWWVATPWLLPVTAIGAFLILYRTRRLAMGGLFIVLSATIITASLASSGVAVTDAIATAFTSYPIVFLAGFMLSEPLTLPPRRWQQLALAAVVAVLFSVPFSVGPIFSSPELALVLGNVLAFVFGQRRGIRLSYLGRAPLTPTSWEFSFRPHRPLTFAPGQYMEITLPHRGADARGLRRIFSIASSPAVGARGSGGGAAAQSGDAGDAASVVKFGLRMPERSSTFKRALLALEPGATVSATSIGGDFVLPRDPTRPLLLVAGGIGITPFISQLEHLEAAGEKRDVVLVYSSSRADEIAYVERLARGHYPVLLVAPEEPVALPGVGAMPSHWTFLGAGPLTGEMLLAAVPDVRGRDAYVSGPPALVTTLRRALRNAGVRRVKSDYFAGY